MIDQMLMIDSKDTVDAMDELFRIRDAIDKAIDQSTSDLTHVAFMTILKAATWRTRIDPTSARLSDAIKELTAKTHDINGKKYVLVEDYARACSIALEFFRVAKSLKRADRT